MIESFKRHFSPTLFAIGIAGIASCEWARTEDETDSLQSEYIMECESVRNGINYMTRCENDEAICYVAGHGISCIERKKR